MNKKPLVLKEFKMTPNPEVVETIDAIIKELTNKQLSLLNITHNGKDYSFRDQLLLEYGDYFPAHDLEETKKKVRKIIDNLEILN